MWKQSLLILSVVLVVSAIKANEAGNNDWSLLQVGEISQLVFQGKKVSVLSEKQGVLATLDKKTGAVEDRKFFTRNQRILHKKQDRILTETGTQEYLEYSLISGDRTHSPKGAYFKTHNPISVCEQHQYLVNATHLIWTENGAQKTQNTNDNEQFVSLVTFAHKSDRKTFIIGKSLTEGKYFINDVDKKQKDRVQLAVSSEEKFEGSSIVADHIHVYFSKTHIALKVSENSLTAASGDSALVFPTRKYAKSENIRLTSSLEGTIYTARQQTPSQVTIHDSVDNELFKIPKHKSDILRGWIHFVSEGVYDVVLQYQDLQLTFYSFNHQILKTVWSREESLSHIQKSLFMNYDTQDDLDSEYHRIVTSQEYIAKSHAAKFMTVPQLLLTRLQNQIKHVTISTLEFFYEFTAFIQNTIAGGNLKGFFRFTMNDEQLNRYGLRRYIIVATSDQTILALDTKNSSILWKVNLPAQYSQGTIVDLVKVKEGYESYVPILAVYLAEKSELLLQKIVPVGDFEEVRAFQNVYQNPHLYKLNPETILVKYGQTTQRYEHRETVNPENQYFFYEVSQTEVQGFQLLGTHTLPLWNIKLAQNQSVLAHSSAYHGEAMSKVTHFDSSRVFFKNVDMSNIAILTTTAGSYAIELMIVNGRTGQVQFNQVKKSVHNKLPVNMVYDENNVIVSYYNLKNKIYEIWSVEAYQERIESSAIAMITDFVEGHIYKPETNRNSIIFLSEVFGSPLSIQKMFVSESKMSLIKRNLLIVTNNNKIYSLNRDLVSNRRPQPDSFFANDKYMPYTYLLPMNPVGFLSYDLRLGRLDHLRFGQTHLESTIFVLGTGLDVFLARTSPDKNFDMIGEEFNYVALICIGVAVSGLVLVLKQRADKAKRAKDHYN